MTDGPNNELPSTVDAGDILSALAMLLRQAVPVDPQLLFGLCNEEIQKQFADDGYSRIMADLADPKTRESHPIWGFYIVSARPSQKTGEHVEIARTEAPKVLDHTQPEYLAQLAAWTNTYMLATTPGIRAAWRAAGWSVNFFQKPAGKSSKPQGKKLQLVKP